MQPGHHGLVHGIENFAGTMGVMGEGAEGSDKQGDGHGGGHTLAADVADDDQHPAGVEGDDLVEVAADFACGQVEAVNAEAGDGRVSTGTRTCWTARAASNSAAAWACWRVTRVKRTEMTMPMASRKMPSARSYT